MRVLCVYFENPYSGLSGFAEACYRISPQIALWRDRAVLLEIECCRNLYSEATILSRVSVVLKKFNRQARICVGDDVCTVLALAIGGDKIKQNLKIEFLPLFVSPFSKDSDFIKNFERITEDLSRLGFQKIQDLKGIRIEGLVSRFGALAQWGVRRFFEPSEAQQIPWPFFKLPERFSEQRELLEHERCAELEPLLFVLKDPIERLFARLRGRGLRMSCLSLRVELEKSSVVLKPVRDWRIIFYTPQSTVKTVLSVLRDRLQRDLENLPLESLVQKLEIEATETAPALSGQSHFFHKREEQEEAWNTLIARVAEKVGKDHVFKAKLTQRYMPEKSWKKEKPLFHPLEKKEKYEDLPYSKRPLRVFDPPKSIHRVGKYLLFEGQKILILGIQGPEIVQEGRFGAFQERHYFQVKNDQGPDFWLFSLPAGNADPTAGTLFLHGVFE